MVFKNWQKRFYHFLRMGEVESKRRQPQKVPSYHLTGNKSMKFIKEADARAKEKELRDKKTEAIKKEAVKKARQIERQNKTKK